MPIERTPTSLRFASKLHAEAVAIVGLRVLADTIQDYESGATIRARIRRLIQLKLVDIGLADRDLDEAINESARMMDEADKIARDLITKAAAK
jgi:hypothetical protein